jgi:hypothetical protein
MVAFSATKQDDGILGDLLFRGSIIGIFSILNLLIEEQGTPILDLRFTFIAN